VREKAYYELAAAAGLKAPRSNFAALSINGEYWGLYVLTEVVNSDFLKNFFGKDNDSGNLYKADIGASFSYLGDDPAAYQQYFEKQSNEDADDWTDLIELSRIIDQSTVDELPAKLEPLVDIDSVLTALAIDNLTVNLDSYVSMGQNFYIYRRPSDNRWVWVPWDPSLAFGGLSQGLSTQQMKELALEYVTTGGAFGGGFGGAVPGDGTSGEVNGGTQSARPLATKLWQVAKYKQRYREIYQQLVNSVLIPNTLVARMNTLRNMIRPWVSADTQKLVTMDQFEQAMTADTSGSMGNGGGQNGLPSNPGGGNGGGLPGGGGFPGGAPGAGGQIGQGTMGSIPGLQPFIEGRIIAVKALLADKTPPTITAAPVSLLFAQATGGAAPAGQTIALGYSDSTLTGSYAATTSADWLRVSPASGSLPATLTVTVNGGSLASGTYTGTVTVKTSGVTNSPLSIPVTLVVAPSASLVTNPSSLSFTSSASASNDVNLPGNATTTQTFVVASTGAAANFTANIADATCTDFLSATPLSGTTPATISVAIHTTGLSAGTCTGTIHLAAAGLSSAAVQVTLTVTNSQAFEPGSISAIVN
ncbi:MAG TPA: CotH kinase family protein, partial [Bryobacteraceae bacterium]|nr:CotH kinase family protein [Bryobacteraceae bacterium]